MLGHRRESSSAVNVKLVSLTRGSSWGYEPRIDLLIEQGQDSEDSRKPPKPNTIPSCKGPLWLAGHVSGCARLWWRAGAGRKEGLERWGPKKGTLSRHPVANVLPEVAQGLVGYVVVYFVLQGTRRRWCESQGSRWSLILPVVRRCAVENRDTRRPLGRRRARGNVGVIWVGATVRWVNMHRCGKARRIRTR